MGVSILKPSNAKQILRNFLLALKPFLGFADSISSKHIERKHTRLYRCQHPKCNGRDFRGMENLRVTLKELEAKKTELMENQAKVDADIKAVKRTMQLVAN